MMLITPAIASEPYSEDAPSVRISMRSTALAGSVLRSTAAETPEADDSLSTTGIAGYPNCKKGLTCTGLWSCRGDGDGGFAFQCSAPDPQEEVCNGADDDCNGQIDDGLRNSAGEYTGVRACGTCATDCFQVLAHLANDDHIRSLPHRGTQRRRKIRGIDADLDLLDHRSVVGMFVLNRIFDRHDVPWRATVDVVDQRRKRSRLARAGRAANEHQPPRKLREQLD